MLLRTLFAVVAICLLASAASAQCPKNLGGLTEQQFDNAYVSLFNKVDRELRRTGHYIYFDDGSYAREATAEIDVTKLNIDVVNYTVCKINSVGVPCWLTASGRKLFLMARIYTVY